MNLAVSVKVKSNCWKNNTRNGEHKNPNPERIGRTQYKKFKKYILWNINRVLCAHKSGFSAKIKKKKQKQRTAKYKVIVPPRHTFCRKEHICENIILLKTVEIIIKIIAVSGFYFNCMRAYDDYFSYMHQHTELTLPQKCETTICAR